MDTIPITCPMCRAHIGERVEPPSISQTSPEARNRMRERHYRRFVDAVTERALLILIISEQLLCGNDDIAGVSIYYLLKLLDFEHTIRRLIPRFSLEQLQNLQSAELWRLLRDQRMDFSRMRLLNIEQSAYPMLPFIPASTERLAGVRDRSGLLFHSTSTPQPYPEIRISSKPDTEAVSEQDWIQAQSHFRELEETMNQIRDEFFHHGRSVADMDSGLFDRAHGLQRRIQDCMHQYFPTFRCMSDTFENGRFAWLEWDERWPEYDYPEEFSEESVDGEAAEEDW